LSVDAVFLPKNVPPGCFLPKKAKKWQAEKQAAPKIAQHPHTLFFSHNTFDKWHGL
jgi:hypothetical protein